MTLVWGFGEIKIHLENGTVVQVLKPVIQGHLEMPTMMLVLCPKIQQMTWVCYLDICLPVHGFSFLFGDHMCKEYICQNEKKHNGHQR